MQGGCAFLGGFLAGFTAYFAKAVVTVFYNANWDEFANFRLYLYIAGLVLSVTQQLRYLNTGLRFFDSLQIVPIYQSLIVLAGMVSGIVYYGDMEHASLMYVRHLCVLLKLVAQSSLQCLSHCRAATLCSQ